MLSPGTWHKEVPRDYEENLAWRKWVLDRANENTELRQAIIYACKNDILFFINTFVYQYNPLKDDDNRVGPFITWAFQERALLDRPDKANPKRKGLIWCIENGESVAVEKSREMGWSWLALILQVWHCDFRSHVQWIDVSKTADAVDSKTQNSLFAKIRFINRHLPDWLVGDLVDQKMFIKYDRTSSEVSGEASTARSTVSARASGLLVDEVAEIEEAAQVWEKSASTANFRIWISTHLSTGNAFYDIVNNPSLVRIRTHWIQHPEKNQGLYSCEGGKTRFWRYDEKKDELIELPGPKDKRLINYNFDMSGKPAGGPYPGIRSIWYDKKAKDIRLREGDDRGVAMQLDINPSGSVSQFYDPLTINRLKVMCHPPVWEGRIKYDQFGQPIEFIKEKDGTIKMWRPLKPNGRPKTSRYGMGIDVSQGTGSTPSCISVVDGFTGEKVLEYVNANIDALSFGTLAVALAWMFLDDEGHGAKICWEHCGPGTVFGKQVWKVLMYRNVYYKTNEGSLGQKISDSPGWNPSATGAKLELHTKYRAALANGEYLNRSWAALDETLNFKHDAKGGSVEHVQFANVSDPTAARENHGDIVVADALGFKMIEGLKVEHEAEVNAEGPNIFSVAGRREFHKDRSRKVAW